MSTLCEQIKALTRLVVNKGEYYSWFAFMVLNSTFNNISVISWRSVLLVEEDGGPEENH